MSLPLTVLLLYAAFLMAVGLWVGRRVHGSSDFFVAGRRLGPGLIFATLLAANLGPGTTVNAAGLAYRDGLSAWWWVGSAGIGSIVLAFWVGPRLREDRAKWGLAHDYPMVAPVFAALRRRIAKEIGLGRKWKS